MIVKGNMFHLEIEDWESIHVNLAAMEAMAQYSVSMEDRATVLCFLEHLEIVAPRQLTQADIDVKSSRFPTQATLE